MFNRILTITGAELVQYIYRRGTWMLLLFWSLIGLFFNYVLPSLGIDDDASLADRLPEAIVKVAVGGFPFFGGAFALILGVQAIGAEFGWGTLKTLLTQGPGRNEIFLGKIAALAVVLIPFTVLPYAIGAISSVFIANDEGAAITWPPIGDIVMAIAASWLILLAWALLGATLGMLTRGTSLAIGVGIIWALVIEGLLGVYSSTISWLGWVDDVMLRSNGYSLVKSIAGISEQADAGPGYYAGPFVSGTQATLYLIGLSVGLVTLSGWIFRRRDIA